MPPGALRVLFVDSSHHFGGATTSLSQLIGAFDPNRVASVVTSDVDRSTLAGLFPDTPTYSLGLPEVLVPEGEDTRAWSSIRRLRHIGAWFYKRDMRGAMALTKLIRRHSIQLVHLNNGAATQLDGILAAKITRTPLFSHHRGIHSSTPSRADLAFNGIPQHHIVISRPVHASLRKLGVPPDKISLVHDGIDTARFRPASRPAVRRALGLPTSTPLVGFFGRLVPWKGPDRFIRALAIAAKTTAFHGIIVGSASESGAAYEGVLRNLVSELGLTDRVTFLGYREDVVQLMQACSAVAHTSVQPEPFGMVVAEAMATGSAVVAANDGGPLEIIRHGVDGLLADPMSEVDFGAALAAVLSNPSVASRLGEAARERIVSQFSAQTYAEGVLSAYAQIGVMTV